ncbi:RagB/SusD family nutrient uptake outer membrane protein [Rubrivirga sp. S365]|uniref:RagB/SusD family nutrient uptake outer membrane protein n=1 Tax=Rubrivirga sp. S365 TaxID=3076080 RepID=UPI0028C5AC57|nr:RagB/SusD family nutrient uptake outer membrane protein [Rubrivirga sp. S365]MDT7855777.1 RagB/SusD family nutrient uptake outer membrane protein [Rubrivirga sp. S365]
MTLPFTKRTRLAVGAALVAAPAFGLAACTDLSVDPFSSVNLENFYQTDAEVLAAVSPVYSQLRATLWEYHNLSEVSSDETIVPTRGSDWADGGRWLNMHRQDWSPTLTDLNGAWVQSFTGIARANSVLSDLTAVDAPNEDQIVAEIRALRAFYYYTLLDLFGNVPILAPPPNSDPSEYLVDPDNPPVQRSRAEVFDFIVAELEASREALPVAGAGNGGRFSQGAVDAILANMYLNAPVFTGTVTAGGLQRGSARWADAEALASRVIDSGTYSLVQGEEEWFEMFSAENENNPEHIFVVQHLAEQGFGMSFPNRGLHYNSFDGGGWNGFATIAETYNAFDQSDPRIGIFARGQAIDYDTGESIENRNGDPLIFTIDFPGGVDNTDEGGGVRIVKFAPDPALTAAINGNHGNDYPYFRLGEMYLIRAEARFEQGNAAGALADINAIRTRVGAPLLTSVDRQAILNERLFELTNETRRRQDLIRADESIPEFGGGGNLFTRAWSFKSASQPYRVLFPIPQQQIDASDGTLTQNAGY